MFHPSPPKNPKQTKNHKPNQSTPQKNPPQKSCSFQTFRVLVDLEIQCGPQPLTCGSCTKKTPERFADRKLLLSKYQIFRAIQIIRSPREAWMLREAICLCIFLHQCSLKQSYRTHDFNKQESSYNAFCPCSLSELKLKTIKFMELVP